MKKFLNFSTILFSYLLITVLVISCGGSSGGSGGSGGSSVGDATNGNGGNGGDATDDTGGNGGDATDDTGGVLPQPEPKDDCLLADRPDKDSLAAVLCYEGELFAIIEKNTAEPQQLDFVIDSVDNPGVTPSRTWDLSTAREIQISHSKDYNLSQPAFDEDEDVVLTEAEGHTAAYPLKLLTINSVVTSKGLISGLLTFNHISIDSSTIQAKISTKLGVKTQEDFISMANVALAGLTLSDYQVPFVLENNLALVAPDGEGAKFDNSIIGVAEKAFDFDGGGYTISLNSEIDTVANDKPAAIIGEIKKASTLRNFTLDINKPISGAEHVGSIVGYSSADITVFKDVKVNINSNLTVYKSSVNEKGYAGGLVGNGCVYINDVIVKTAKNVAIRAALKDHGRDSTTGDYELFHPNLGGLVGNVTCNEGSLIAIKNNVVDVTIGGYAAGNNAPNNMLDIGGLVSTINNMPEISNNLVKLAIYKDGNLPADFIFAVLAGLARLGISLDEVTNNLVYVDFSNIGSVNYVGGLFGQIQDTVAANNIANNMVFIADGFTGSEVLSSFGAATPNYLITSSSFEGLNINNIFVSSPITDDQYDTNVKLASFVHSANSDMTFNNLILDNTLYTVMFKAGNELTNLQGKVGGTNAGLLFTLSEAKTDDLTTLFSENNTSWETVGGGYPQLKAPAALTGSVTKAEIEQAWTETNEDIQTGLAARAASLQIQ